MLMKNGENSLNNIIRISQIVKNKTKQNGLEIWWIATCTFKIKLNVLRMDGGGRQDNTSIAIVTVKQS